MYTAMPLHCPWLEKEQIDVCCETETATILRERGQKLTPQRMELVTALRHADGQLTAAELLRRARQAHAAVNTSTVFRTMALLRDLGLAIETRTAAHGLVYEWNATGTHQHLECRRCGHLQPFDTTLVRLLAGELNSTHGFAVDLMHFAIAGTCRECVTLSR